MINFTSPRDSYHEHSVQVMDFTFISMALNLKGPQCLTLITLLRDFRHSASSFNPISLFHLFISFTTGEDEIIYHSVQECFDERSRKGWRKKCVTWRNDRELIGIRNCHSRWICNHCRCLHRFHSLQLHSTFDTGCSQST